MNRFNFHDSLNFDPVDLTPPHEVVLNLGDELLEATKGYVKIGIAGYSEKVIDRKPTFATSIHAMFQNTMGTCAAQEELGKRGEVSNQYEVFLYTPSYQDYRFRLLFLRFGIAHYPVEVILEQGVANALNNAIYSDSFIIAKDKESFERMIVEMLNTEYVKEVMQEFIRIKQLQDYKVQRERKKKMNQMLGLNNGS